MSFLFLSLALLSSVSIALLLKVLEQQQRNRAVIVAANYIAAGTLGCLFSRQTHFPGLWYGSGARFLYRFYPALPGCKKERHCQHGDHWSTFPGHTGGTFHFFVGWKANIDRYNRLFTHILYYPLLGRKNWEIIPCFVYLICRLWPLRCGNEIF